MRSRLIVPIVSLGLWFCGAAVSEAQSAACVTRQNELKRAEASLRDAELRKARLLKATQAWQDGLSDQRVIASEGRTFANQAAATGFAGILKGAADATITMFAPKQVERPYQVINDVLDGALTMAGAVESPGNVLTGMGKMVRSADTPATKAYGYAMEAMGQGTNLAVGAATRSEADRFLESDPLGPTQEAMAAGGGTAKVVEQTRKFVGAPPGAAGSVGTVLSATAKGLEAVDAGRKGDYAKGIRTGVEGAGELAADYLGEKTQKLFEAAGTAIAGGINMADAFLEGDRITARETSTMSNITAHFITKQNELQMAAGDVNIWLAELDRVRGLLESCQFSVRQAENTKRDESGRSADREPSQAVAKESSAGKSGRGWRAFADALTRIAEIRTDYNRQRQEMRNREADAQVSTRSTNRETVREDTSGSQPKRGGCPPGTDTCGTNYCAPINPARKGCR